MSGVLNALLGSYAARGGAFESIATATPSGVFTFDFNSIPSTYTHLQLRCHAIMSGTGETVAIRFNGDTNTNYSLHWLSGDGANVSAVGVGFAASGRLLGAGQGSFGSTIPLIGVINIHDYANTNKNTTVQSYFGSDNNGSGEVGLVSSLWRNTSAVSSITIFSANNSQTFNSGSTFALYGIKAAA